MKLKKSVASLDDVEERYRPLYEKQGDEFVLPDDLEIDTGGGGAVGGGGEGGDALRSELRKARERLDEFRSNNRNLFRELEETKKRMESYADIDPERARKAEEALSKIEAKEEQELVRAGKIDDVVKLRTTAMQADHKAQMTAAQKTIGEQGGTINSMRDEIGRLKIDTAIAAAVDGAKVRLQDGALSDVKRRARETWKIDDQGGMVPTTDGNLSNKRYGKDGETPITMGEWFQAEIVEGEGKHLLLPASGGGAKGGDRTDTAAGKRTVGTNPLEFGKNLEKIASGEVEVSLGGETAE